MCFRCRFHRQRQHVFDLLTRLECTASPSLCQFFGCFSSNIFPQYIVVSLLRVHHLLRFYSLCLFLLPFSFLVFFSSDIIGCFVFSYGEEKKRLSAGVSCYVAFYHCELFFYYVAFLHCELSIYLAISPNSIGKDGHMIAILFCRIAFSYIMRGCCAAGGAAVFRTFLRSRALTRGGRRLRRGRIALRARVARVVAVGRGNAGDARIAGGAGVALGFRAGVAVECKSFSFGYFSFFKKKSDTSMQCLRRDSAYHAYYR
jgi:hypothetical protein